MTISRHVSDDERTVTISISGRFDFQVHKEFRAAYDQDEHAADVTFIVDLKATDYIDSSALGMLLLLRERVGEGKVVLANCKEQIASIFRIANFGKLFRIEQRS